MYYGTQLDNRVKRYCHLNLHGASVVNFEHIDILQDSIKHLSKMLLSFEFARIIHFLFRGSRYTAGLNRTSE